MDGLIVLERTQLLRTFLVYFIRTLPATMFNTVYFWYLRGVRNSFLFFYFLFYEWKSGLTHVIIDLAYLNPLLMAWDTFGHVRTIRIMAQHFCKIHHSNLVTPELTSVTKSKTPTNAPGQGARNSYLFCIPWPPHIFERRGLSWITKEKYWCPSSLYH